MTDAAALKAEGNKLFSQKNYPAAIEKYTAAINADGQNAVLYANRAACYLSLKEYLNAVGDANQAGSLSATKIDPTYSKAYARLGTAHDKLSEHWLSVNDWQKALDTLPPGDDRTREQYAAGLRAAQLALEKLKDAASDRAIVMNSRTTTLPWVAARPLLPGLVTRRETRSSAWVIHEAYQACFLTFLIIFHRPLLMGRLGLLERITDAILQDNRVFHLTDNNFISNYNRQVQLEATQSQAWPESGPNQIKKEALQRLQQHGWDNVRSALSVTIRCWIMRGYIDGNLRGQRQAEIEFLSRALDILEWGVKPGQTSPAVTGAPSLRLLSFAESAHSTNHLQDLEDLLRRAEDQIREIDENPFPTDTDAAPGWVLAFGDYCKGHAYAMKGFYYNQRGNKELQAERKTNPDAGHEFYRQAAAAYVASAECFPQDDETHAWFLSCALQAMWSYRAPIRDQLPPLDKLRESQPLMLKIWKYSQMSQGGRDMLIDNTLRRQDTYKAALANGTATLDDRRAAT
ncbi:hypothetical protein BDZ89DRAFT_1128611 [Hymenopellis radicata]|nr:hypothetical protein BDZ89DRAFT_1128611 [Hymenopellis radicata]